MIHQRLSYQYALLILCAFTVFSSSVAAVTYTIRDVGSASIVFDEESNKHVVDLNDNGLVTGWIRRLNAQTSPADEGILTNEADSMAYAVNNLNEIVGWSQNADGVKVATLWIPNELGFWEAMPQETSLGKSVAHDINDDGLIAGEATLDGVMTAVTWDVFNGMQIVDIPDAVSSIAYGVNNESTVVGEYYLEGDASPRAFVWNELTGLINLGGLGGESSSSWVSQINNHDVVVGGSKTSPLCNPWACFSVYHAFQWDVINGMLDLSSDQGAYATTWATDVNDEGIVIGAMFQYPESIALIWNNGERTELTDAIPNDSGWVLIEPLRINNGGQIVGRGTLNGEQRIFLLTPEMVSNTDEPIPNEPAPSPTPTPAPTPSPTPTPTAQPQNSVESFVPNNQNNVTVNNHSNDARVKEQAQPQMTDESINNNLDVVIQSATEGDQSIVVEASDQTSSNSGGSVNVLLLMMISFLVYLSRVRVTWRVEKSPNHPD